MSILLLSDSPEREKNAILKLKNNRILLNVLKRLNNGSIIYRMEKSINQFCKNQI